MNIQPWIDGDLVRQEQEGYEEGQRHCKQGWATDSSCNENLTTPFIRGYRRGWDEAHAAGLHGTVPIMRTKIRKENE